MSNIVMDEITISTLFSQIEKLIEASRQQLDNIVATYRSRDTYNTLITDKNLDKLYANTADDYSKLCYLKQGIDEAVIDVRSIRRRITASDSGLIPSVAKSYRYRAENIIEDLASLKDAVVSARDGLSASVRYLSSLSYASYDKFGGSKC